MLVFFYVARLIRIPEYDSMKKIALLTSGGDAPGMNAAIRAVVRTLVPQGIEVHGVLKGYQGLLNSEIIPLDLGSVANILQRGGTILKSGRCEEFKFPEQRKKAAENFKARGLNGLIVIGGDGTTRGAHLLSSEHNIRAIGLPGTIDNDIWGTDMTIGFDTAANTALDAIDRIRDTADSHERVFIVEVMGRDSGFLAIEVGLAGGAEGIFIPEVPYSIDNTIQHIQRGLNRGKASSILVTAEGQKPGRAYDLAETIRKKSGFEAKVCVLGHIQRGGSPTASDRNLASRLGSTAAELLLQGHSGFMLGIRNNQVTATNFEQVYSNKKKVPSDLIELAQKLAQ